MCQSQLCFIFVRCPVFHTDPDDPSSSDDEGMPYTRPAKFKAAHSFKGPFDFDQIKVVQDLSGEHMVRGSLICFNSCIFVNTWPNEHLNTSVHVLSSGGRLDDEVLSLWEAAGIRRPG